MSQQVDFVSPCTYLARPQEACNRAVPSALWGEGLDVNDRARLEERLNVGGLDGNALLEAADETRYGDRLAENTETAAQRGVFGSPTFIVADDVFFGNDRLEFLEQRRLLR